MIENLDSKSKKFILDTIKLIYSDKSYFSTYYNALNVPFEQLKDKLEHLTKDTIILALTNYQKALQKQKIPSPSRYFSKCLYTAILDIEGNSIIFDCNNSNLHPTYKSKSKPTNCGNFEQRMYDDSFYDGLYDNVK